jgi:hypothetical protein
MYKNWTSAETGELLFPAQQPGSESGWEHLMDGTVFQPGCKFSAGYYVTQVQG